MVLDAHKDPLELIYIELTYTKIWMHDINRDYLDEDIK